MAKIYHKEFKKKLDDKKKIIWTNEPKHENKFKTNLKEKRAFFKTTLETVIENPIIKKNKIPLIKQQKSSKNTLIKTKIL